MPKTTSIMLPPLICVVTAMALGACTMGDRAGRGTDPPTAVKKVEVVAARGETTPFPGYTLFHPLRSTSVYLVDMDGDLVHQWETEYNTGQSVYLLPSGNLLRASRDPEPAGPYRGGGEGGIIQEIAWDGTVVWNFKFSDQDKRHHHDIEPMPNGNVLLIGWENRTYEEAVQAGINPERMREDHIWPDFVIEIEPVYPDGGNVVWEWHAWDHLVQELYRDKDNYGVVAEHPELIDINAAPSHRARQDAATPESVDQLRALGYIAGNAASDDRPEIGADWMHINSIDYNAELDQILLSSRHFSEIWIIDHSTTTEEAAGHTGGRQGRGGDLLYRWGNPEAFGVGTPADRTLYVQHDARWIEPGLPGAGNILIFNNGAGRPDGNYSSVVEIAPPLHHDGTYVMEPEVPTGATVVWEYVAADPQSMYAGLLSGAHRLPNGNTLVAVGTAGRMLEIGAGNEVVWEFTNPYVEDEDRQSSDRVARAFGGDDGARGGRRRGPPGARGRPGGPPGPPDDDGMEGDRGGRDGPPPGPGRGDGIRGDQDGDRGGRGRRGPRPGSIYRATRIPADHPGLARLHSSG